VFKDIGLPFKFKLCWYKYLATTFRRSNKGTFPYGKGCNSKTRTVAIFKDHRLSANFLDYVATMILYNMLQRISYA
jgi:hypothetical protein